MGFFLVVVVVAHAVLKYVVFWGAQVLILLLYIFLLYLDLADFVWKSCLCCKPPFPLLPQHSQWQLLLWLAFSMGTHCCCHPLHGKLSFGSWYVVPDQVCDFVYKLEYHWLRASCALSQRQFVTCEILQLSVPSQFTIILHMSILYSPPKGIRSCAEIVSASSSSTVERKWLNCFLFFFLKKLLQNEH